MSASKATAVQAVVAGRLLTEIDLLRWEVRRARVAKALLIERLGADGTVNLLKHDLAVSAELASEWVATSGGRHAASITELEVKGGNAAGFLRWLHGRFAEGDHRTLNGASPEHYALRRTEQGWMDVTETIGGYGVPIRFYVVVSPNPADAPAEPDPALPQRLIGHIRGVDGTQYGKVMHQFGDTDTGFRARLGVFWPAAAPQELVTGHCWHLAGEFSNWINAYLASEAE